jgi:hypothetical protein
MQQVNENLNIITNEILSHIIALNERPDSASKVLMSRLIFDVINQISSCKNYNFKYF